MTPGLYPAQKSSPRFSSTKAPYPRFSQPEKHAHCVAQPLYFKATMPRCGSGVKSGHTALFSRSHRLEGVWMPPPPPKGQHGRTQGQQRGRWNGSRPQGRLPSVTSGVPARSSVLADNSPATFRSEPDSSPPFFHEAVPAPIRSMDRKTRTRFHRRRRVPNTASGSKVTGT